ncbi:ATPase [Candidatus Peregrinibacteria bacterium HGW-Peregrinibacteria-1]|jgi:Ca2+-transporting ATPase|nr:MAG: ATPase [Candidatus Peregrinibacteria bacterium HGW-Peregrinibacteria-1]
MNYKELTKAQIPELRSIYGFNEIKLKKDFTLFKILISQFTSYLIIILMIAGGISIYVGETVDGIAILTIVVINAIIGFTQEYKADNAVKKLKSNILETTIVYRDGQQSEIPIRELLPGDIVIINEGDKIPADIELLESFSMQVNESMLTGESSSVNKDNKTNNKLFKGTITTTGRGIGKVLTIGQETEFGKIIGFISQNETTSSPLTAQLNQLGKKLGITILILIAILIVINLYKKTTGVEEMLMTSIALGVSAIPEGLPIIITLTLATAVQILARKNAIVRKMSAIETLGATTIICSDKTGTLTLNEMTVTSIYSINKKQEIKGQGYELTPNIKIQDPDQQKLIEIGTNCNNAYIGQDILGDPTEIALKVLAKKAKIESSEPIDENTFTSERKMMSVLVATDNRKEIQVKGALESVLTKCKQILDNGKIRPITEKDIEQIKKTNISYAKKALRVLATAYKPYKSKFDENNLIFVGLVAMLDPPRSTVKESLSIAKKAGIKVKIITGDNAITAKAIASQIGISSSNILTGADIDELTDQELQQHLKTTNIFARTNPEHKYRIVKVLRNQGEIVAVTGDGVNDAPALKHAHVGIAMGIKGTEATKEVADIVLKDDNFTTIVNTIEEGRRIYRNILSFIKYMLSANFDTIMAVGVITIMGYPLPILPLQILWLNIATDGLPALALGKSPAPANIMLQKPQPNNESLFRKFLPFIFTAVLLQTIINIVIYFYGYGLDNQLGINTFDLSEPSYARTLVFTQVVIFQLFFVFICKDDNFKNFKTFFNNKHLIYAVSISLVMQIAMIHLPFMQTIFKTVPLSISQWLLVTLAASTCFLIPLITNKIKKHAV